MSFRRRGIAASVAALTLGGSAVATFAGASTPTSRWAETATKAVGIDASRLLGAAPAGELLNIGVSLTPRNAAEMSAAVTAMYTKGSPSYHQFLTPSEWAAKYAPSEATVAAVKSYLSHEGLTHISIASDHLLVSADATVATAERAFHTTLSQFKLGGRDVVGNTTAALVPAALSGKVNAVLGLNTSPLTTPKLTTKKPGSPDIEGGLFPKAFDTTYDAKGTHAGNKTKIAILTEGNVTGTIKSLRLAEKKEHAKRVKVSVINVNPPSADTSGADEFDMDSQVSTIDATSVKHLYMYNIGSLVDSNVEADFVKFVSQDKASALSASIGGCDINAYLDGSMVATDVALQQGALQGQTVMASSGDNGEGCTYVAAVGAPAGAPEPNFPCDSEYVLCVGGTSLVTDKKGNRITEIAWVGSGGGISQLSVAGAWTQDTDPDYETGAIATGGRAVPDIALDADPNVATPVKVYVGKTISYVGGTSLSSPMFLGFWARLESGHGNRLGFAPPSLYGIYDKVNPGTPETTPEVGITVVVPTVDPKPVKGFTDITVGTNGAFVAMPGYDETTGLGAPDVKALNKLLKTTMPKHKSHRHVKHKHAATKK